MSEHFIFFYALLSVTATIIGSLLCSHMSLRSERRYLVLKSDPKDRTPAKIDGGFYYIVPESEYVDLQLNQRRANRVTDTSDINKWLDEVMKEKN